jgi:hypothetical protein
MEKGQKMEGEADRSTGCTGGREDGEDREEGEREAEDGRMDMSGSAGRAGGREDGEGGSTERREGREVG